MALQNTWLKYKANFFPRHLRLGVGPKFSELHWVVKKVKEKKAAFEGGSLLRELRATEINKRWPLPSKSARSGDSTRIWGGVLMMQRDRNVQDMC